MKWFKVPIEGNKYAVAIYQVLETKIKFLVENVTLKDFKGFSYRTKSLYISLYLGKPTVILTFS